MHSYNYLIFHQKRYNVIYTREELGCATCEFNLQNLQIVKTKKTKADPEADLCGIINAQV